MPPSVQCARGCDASVRVSADAAQSSAQEHQNKNCPVSSSPRRGGSLQQSLMATWQPNDRTIFRDISTSRMYVSTVRAPHGWCRSRPAAGYIQQTRYIWLGLWATLYLSQSLQPIYCHRNQYSRKGNPRPIILPDASLSEIFGKRSSSS